MSDAPVPRRLLIVSYDFPPSAVGIWRTIKFCRYLPHFGWQPAVLTVRDVRSPRWDPAPLDELPPGTEVRRTESWDPFRVSHRIASLRPARAKSVGAAANPKPTNERFRRVMDVLRRWVLMPDDKCGWIPFAVREGIRWARTGAFDAVYTTSFPNSSHLVGLRIAEATGLPLLADFRDIWVGNYYFYDPPTGWHDRYQRGLEAAVVRRAQAVVAATEPIRVDFIERYPTEPATKFHTITNGFDPEDFEGLRPHTRGATFTITYAGTMYGSTSPDAFLRAVAAVLEAMPKRRSHLRLRFCGTMLEPYRRLIDEHGLADITQVDAYLSHREALQVMVDAELLLLLISPQPGSHIMMTQKVFEYLGAQRPILAIVPEGAARELLKPLDGALLAMPGDVEAIRSRLEEALAAWESGTPITAASQGHRAYERRALTAQLAGILDSIASPKGRRA